MLAADLCDHFEPRPFLPPLFRISFFIFSSNLAFSNLIKKFLELKSLITFRFGSKIAELGLFDYVRACIPLAVYKHDFLVLLTVRLFPCLIFIRNDLLFILSFLPINGSIVNTLLFEFSH